MFLQNFNRLSKFLKFSIPIFSFWVLVYILAGPNSKAFGNELVQPWGYEGGTGPLHWGEMEQDHEKHLMCREGIHQSPVNIQTALTFENKELNTHYFKTQIKVINNKHTVLFLYGLGSYVEWGNETFELIQFHFHHPSEHRLKGKSFPMEIHFVHKAPNHEYVIIAVLVKLGEHNPHIQKLWKTIPEEIDKEHIFKNKTLSAKDFLPKSRTYYHYTGSLTTPPCTENVTWLILEEPIKISSDQLEYFQSFIDHNARPIQHLHHRVIVKLK